MPELIKKYLFETIIIAILVSINIFLQFLPLTNVLGYEISAINGIILFVLGGFSIIKFGRKDNDFQTFRLMKSRQKFFVAIALLPIVISLFNTVVLSICPMKNGIEFYLIDTIPALFIGLILASICLRISSKFSYYLFGIVFFIFVLTPVFELYYFHQMYFYNPLIGFFPGTIYDENIVMHSKHFLYQLFATKLTFLAYVLLIKKDKGFKVFLPVFLAVFLGIPFFKPVLGFATNLPKIKRILPNEYITDNFSIIYPGGISKQEIKMIAAEHEFYYQKIAGQLGYSPDEKITSILFENRSQKGKVFGAENADVAKLWMNTIYLQIDDYSSTLEHELVHVFSKKIGTTPFKVAANLNFSMIEGYAMAVEDEYGGKEVHHFAALAFNNGFKVSPEKLFSGLSFFGNVSGLSYVIAGSFFKYLIENYSNEQVNKVYNDGDFETHFNKSLAELSDDYEKFINSYELVSNKHTTVLYFGRKPLIKRFCPRYIARQRTRAEDFFSKKMYDEAEEIYNEIFSHTNNYFALSGIINCRKNRGEIQEALEFAKKYATEYNGTSYKYGYSINLADLFFRNGELSRADSIYSELIYEDPTESYTNLAKIRRMVIEQPDTISEKYIQGSNFDRYLILKRLNSINPKDFLIPSLINLSASFNENYNSFIDGLSRNLNVISKESSFAAYKLSEYAKSRSQFKDAVRFARIALESCDDKSRISILKENLEKLEWMKEYCD